MNPRISKQQILLTISTANLNFKTARRVKTFLHLEILLKFIFHPIKSECLRDAHTSLGKDRNISTAHRKQRHSNVSIIFRTRGKYGKKSLRFLSISITLALRDFSRTHSFSAAKRDTLMRAPRKSRIFRIFAFFYRAE